MKWLKFLFLAEMPGVMFHSLNTNNNFDHVMTYLTTFLKSRKNASLAAEQKFLP
jgi:hypothetical protein